MWNLRLYISQENTRKMFDLFLTYRHCTSSVSKVKRGNFYFMSWSVLQTIKTLAVLGPVLLEANRGAPQMNLLAAPKCGSTQTQPSCCFNCMRALMSEVGLMCSPSFAAHQTDSVSFHCHLSKCGFSSPPSPLIISFAVVGGCNWYAVKLFLTERFPKLLDWM